MPDKKTLLDAVREHGIFEIKEVTRLTGVSPQTLNNWLKNKPELLEIVLIGVKAKKESDKFVAL